MADLDNPHKDWSIHINWRDRSCPSRNGDGEENTFEQMSAITRADAGKIIPCDATYPFTDKTGATYFQIRPHTWMHQEVVEQFSQHDLAGLDFDCIEAEHTTE